MATTTPRDLMYSAALKPVSIASTAQTRKFLPITSGSYTATGNNIIRIPVNANGFVDMKNAMLKYRLTTGGAGSLFNGAHAPFQRQQWLSPDGAPLETIDNYNRVYDALEALEMSRDNIEGFQNLLSASSHQDYNIMLDGSSATAVNVIYNGTNVAAIDFAVASSYIRVADWRFATNSTGLQVTINWLDEELVLTQGGTTAGYIGGHYFAFTFGGAGNIVSAVAVDGVTVSATTFTVLSRTAKTHSGNSQSTYLANGDAITVSHNPMSCLTKLDVLYPAFAVGGGGAVLELTLDANNTVLSAFTKAAAPTYTIDAVELVVPVIQYPESVVQSFKQMVNSVGAVSMSSTSLQNYVYPYTGTPSSLSIPIAVRNRSLKAIYFFFQESISSDNSINRMARDAPSAMNYYLRIGSQYFPAQQITYGQTNLTEAVIELGKSVSKLNDIRHGSILNRRNFITSAAEGGQSVFGIDLEASAVSFLENGINTADNALSCYLEISNLTGLVAGNVQIYALFDNTISVMANGNLLVTK